HAYGFDVLDAFATADLFEDLRHLVDTIGRDQCGSISALDFGGRIAVELLRPLIPVDNDVVQRRGEYGVIRILDNGCQAAPILLQAPAFGDVHRENAHRIELRRQVDHFIENHVTHSYRPVVLTDLFFMQVAENIRQVPGYERVAAVETFRLAQHLFRRTVAEGHPAVGVHLYYRGRVD